MSKKSRRNRCADVLTRGRLGPTSAQPRRGGEGSVFDKSEVAAPGGGARRRRARGSCGAGRHRHRSREGVSSEILWVDVFQRSVLPPRGGNFGGPRKTHHLEG